MFSFFDDRQTTTRWMRRDDIGAVVAIDRAGFDRDTPWGHHRFKALIEAGAAALVATRGDAVEGFVFYSFRAGKVAGSGHITITRLVVRPGRRRRRVGTLLVGRIAEKLAVGFHDRLVVPVHERNAAGHAFLARLGFRATLRRFEAGPPRDDEYVFSRGIGVQAAASGMVGKGVTR